MHIISSSPHAACCLAPTWYGELRTWPTSEEIAADQQRRTVQDQQAQQQRAVQAQRDAESAARINSLCEEQQMCVRYGNAAKHCAVAANFDSCMKVMMPGEDVVASYDCRSDGSLKQPPAEPPADMPSRFT